MAPFMYFLPAVTREQLFTSVTAGVVRKGLVRSVLQGEAASLLDVLGDVSSQDDICATNVQRGPDNLSGAIVVALPNDRTRTHEQHYRSDQQEWFPAGDGKNLWVGVVASQPPSPADISRRKVHTGYPIELGDGQRWTVPVIRRPPIATRYGMSETELPRDFVYGPDGELVEKLQAKYQAAWDATREVSDLFYTGDGTLNANPSCPIAWGVGKCIDVLTINYRYGRHEQTVLRLVNSENWVTILACAVDRPSVEEILDSLAEAQKKSESQSALDTPSSETGPAEDIESTDPAAAIYS